MRHTLKIKPASRIGRARFPGCVVLLGVLVLARSVVAEQIQVTLDPAQTTVDWTLGTTLHTVHGTFKMKSGAISFDPKTGTASGLVIVDATSGDSGNRSRDKRMHKEILESQRYPEITFIPEHVIGSIPQTGNTTIQVQGVFHIHGADHDLTLSIPVAVNGYEVKTTTSFVVPYQDWGMKDPSNFLLHVEKKVTVNVSAVGRVMQGRAVPVTH